MTRPLASTRKVRTSSPRSRNRSRRRRGVLPGGRQAAPLDVPALRHEDVADNSFAQQLYGFDHRAGAAALSAMLDMRLVARRRLDQQPALANVVRDRFFDIDMLARIAGQDRCRRVPMIRSRHDHRIDRLVIEHPPHVSDRFAGRHVQTLRRRPAPRVIHVTDRGDFDVRQVLEPAGITHSATTTDQRDHQLVVRPQRAAISSTLRTDAAAIPPKVSQNRDDSKVRAWRGLRGRVNGG